MGAKKSGKRRTGGRGPGRANDFRQGAFNGPVQGDGTQNNTYVQQYAPVPTALASLPPLPEEFTGRDHEIDDLLTVLDPAGGAGPVAGAVAGLAGVGKTTLAHAVAHAAVGRGWFTGVQRINLRGYDPAPVRPEEALDALLRSLGVIAEHIPPTLTEREALYRSQLDVLARKNERILLIADNASTAEQVRTLLPARPHAALITSRHTLPGIGARLKNLNTLQPEAAVDVLRKVLQVADPDDDRVDESPTAADELALACGYLPLALQITGALLAGDPGQPLAERVQALTTAGSRLSGLDDGERNLRAAFDQSADRLTPQEADLFRLISLNPGPDISTAAATALADRPTAEVDRLLTRLTQAHLLDRGAVRGRWQMHDLVREYATEQARIHTDRGRPTKRRYDQAQDRLMAYYLHVTDAADTHLRPPGSGPVSGLFTDRPDALAWLDKERSNLVAAVHTAHAIGHAPTAVLLPNRLIHYLTWRRHFNELISLSSVALEAQREIGNHRAEGDAWNNLGLALQNVDRYEEAMTAHETARTIYQTTGAQHSEGKAWNNLGTALHLLGRHAEAITAYETARTLHRTTGYHHAEGQTWNNLGVALQSVHRYEEAMTAHETARTIYQTTGDHHSEGKAWNNLGTALRGARHLDEALAAGNRAAELLTAANDHFLTGQALAEVAATLTAADAAPEQIRETWLRSAAAYEQAGAPDEAAASREKATDPPPPPDLT
ncbi:tetratricopeptide repeat protein [Streptomyces sp. NPDC055749]